MPNREPDIFYHPILDIVSVSFDFDCVFSERTVYFTTLVVLMGINLDRQVVKLKPYADILKELLGGMTLFTM